MARIIGGLAVSHTPTISFAVDHDEQEEAAWALIFESFEAIKAWLEANKPHVRFYISSMTTLHPFSSTTMVLSP